MRHGRRLGVDVGDVRIGVAICDPEGLIATDLDTVAAGPTAVEALMALMAEHGVMECVIGLPLSLSGKEGPAATKVRMFASMLAGQSPAVPIRLVDERMSTVEASHKLRTSGVTARKQKKSIDKAAARIILQSALDIERTSGHVPGWGVTA